MGEFASLFYGTCAQSAQRAGDLLGVVLLAVDLADVAKLVYALDLGSSGATRESSSLSVRTILFVLARVSVLAG